MALTEYEGHPLQAVDDPDNDLRDVGEPEGEESEPLPDDAIKAVIERAREVLGDRVKAVRPSNVLTGNPARLLTGESAVERNMQRVRHLLDQDIEETEPEYTLELNPRHPLIANLAALIHRDGESALINRMIESVFDGALLANGAHPNPAEVVPRLYALMESAASALVPEDAEPEA
jgi:molecular chaperone HtpG